jgi:hypothetical protein
MAILDERNEFCDATALNTGGAASYLIGDVIDLQSAGLDLGQAADLYLVVTIDTLPTSGGAATAAFSLCSDAQAAIAVDGTQTIHYTSKAYTIAQMAAGTVVVKIKLPHSPPEYERYLGIVQTTAAAAFTAGKVNAFLTHDYGIVKHYADASQ